jgi:uncharacterized phage-associated protein
MGAAVTMFCAVPTDSDGDMRQSLLDPRGICNLMLDEADRNQTPVSNLVLQKLLYFAHGFYLVERGWPLVSGYFEAWKRGPVHPGAYKAFKVAGNRPISFRVEREDPLTGNRAPIPYPKDQSIVRLVRRVVLSFGPMAPEQLVNLSHAPESPWDFVVKQSNAAMTFGLRISDDIIKERFCRHKLSVDCEMPIGEPGEDAPFA